MNMQRPGPWLPMSPSARTRVDLVLRILEDLGAQGSFLEVGCGQGSFATVLAEEFEYVGYEPDETSFQVAQASLRNSSAGLVVNSVLPPDVDNLFDVLGAFEVLEHLEHDHEAMSEWVEWVRPGGHVVVSVPAHPGRFGPADTQVGHFRRYTRTAIEAVLSGAGLVNVQSETYGFPLGYLLEFVRNVIASRVAGDETPQMEDRTAASGRFLQPQSAVAPLIWAGTLPFIWFQRMFVRTELGTGFVAYGRRPN